MIRRLTALHVFVTLLATASSALAQGRSSVDFSTIGRGTQLGGTAASRTFRQYSTGVGSLSRSSRGGGTSVLRSSLSAGSLSVSRRRGSLAGTGSELGTGTLGSTTDRPSATRGTDYGNSAGLIRARGGTSSPLTKLARTDPLYGTRAFLSAVQDDDAILAEREKPITSLVPDRPGKYRDYLAKGERYFRAARYPDALDWFEMASVFDGDDPESLLSITHAKTAMQAYPSAAFSLRKAVRNFPELPLLPLRPSGFYASPLDYSDQLAQLRKYVERNSFDADGHLLLAYYQWFEGETEQAKESLATAHRKARNLRGKTRETVIEAIDIFWKGMVATGKVSGDLIEKPEADTTTRPAAGEESEDDAPQDGTAEASGQ